MSHDTVLIAGFSGRALAASARRAGYLPLVADAFGDTDTRELATACEVLPSALHKGFRYTTLCAALDRLKSERSHRPSASSSLPVLRTIQSCSHACNNAMPCWL